MSDDNGPQGDLADEFRTLGKNLAEAMRSAWESPERKRLQQEIETGLIELGTTLRTEFNTFNESSTAQRLKEDVQDLGSRMRTGQVQDQVRSELISVMRMVNLELQKATTRWTVADSAPDQPVQEAAAAETETPPAEASQNE